MNIDYSTLPEAELKRARRNAEIERSSITSAMIECGRGHELASETLAKARAGDTDALTRWFAAVSSLFQAIICEEERRMTYHGSLKRIHPHKSLRRYSAFNP